jgi:hypothetical protein
LIAVELHPQISERLQGIELNRFRNIIDLMRYSVLARRCSRETATLVGSDTPAGATAMASTHA